jgi:nucleotide-binding universal stress UspA family protein
MNSRAEHPARQILVATDFSDSAEAALAVAAEYARALHAGLHVFHVFSRDEVEVARLLSEAASRAGSEVNVTVGGAGGDPAEEILHYAGHHPIDLIVVGTHGRTRVSRVLLGSVADRVIRGSTCPVLVVPLSVTSAKVTPSAPMVAAEHVVPKPQRCLVCATESRDLICEPCRARIRGEALSRKHREERAGRA